ncbi:NADPH:quinone reductase [Sphingomonas sp. NFR04]|uniref:quinone oxidoreductase family protein n=1 Tax=Sphingomonas sp. NFR04 TaxID=1566283 RepID=UPI0008E5D08F|nr:zinc-binding alcohol dehydrogenase family protein [Sphingomonas sp. NFR04]SFK59157.1 NADPH:quinone reductase [Sphingomonas sp. NFR04]
MASTNFRAIGYTEARAGLPLVAFDHPIPVPGAGEVLVQVLASSLNPLEYKLAELNFMGRAAPVPLGFDLAGYVAAVGPGVETFEVGDPVAAMADCDGDGGWAEGGAGYAIARAALTVRKPSALSFAAAGTLPACFLAAHLALTEHLAGVQSIYIPGGGGGVGHLAVQIAKKVFDVPLVISSAGRADSRTLAEKSGADIVLDRQLQDIPREVTGLTAGQGVDFVFDATYSEIGFVETAGLVRRGGAWSVLGVGPGRTTRTSETKSPVTDILAAREATLLNANVLSFFSTPASGRAQHFAPLEAGMRDLARWTALGRVTPHIGATLPGTTEAISHGLAELKAGTAPVGKIAVQLGHSAGQ